MIVRERVSEKEINRSLRRTIQTDDSSLVCWSQAWVIQGRHMWLDLANQDPYRELKYCSGENIDLCLLMRRIKWCTDNNCHTDAYGGLGRPWKWSLGGRLRLGVFTVSQHHNTNFLVHFFPAGLGASVKRSRTHCFLRHFALPWWMTTLSYSVYNELVFLVGLILASQNPKP